MRRLSRIVAVSTVVTLALAGCSRQEGTGEAADGGNGTTEELCSADGDGPNIGLAYDVGGRGDESFNDLAAAGVMQASEELGATCTEAEAQADESESAKEERLRTLADTDHNPIVAVGGAYVDATATVSAEYPDIDFAVVDGFMEGDNVTNLVFSAEQGAYLVGIAAALATETDQLGFVGGAPGPVIDPFAAGFQAGAQSVNPDIKVEMRFLSDALDAKAFANVSGGRTAANALYDGGADIVFHAAGESGTGVFQAADERDLFAIGVDADQYNTAAPEFQDNILTSSLKKVDVAVFDFLQSFDDGDVEAGFDLYDLSRDGVGYSTSGGYVDEYVDQLEEAKDAIIAGDITVPSTL